MTTALARLARPAFWAAILLLALLSLLPKEQMARTGAAGWLEHFGAYAGTMLLGAVGYARRIGLARPALVLIAYAAVLELLQYFSPGRSPGLLDFAAGAAGVVATAWIFHFMMAREREPQ